MQDAQTWRVANRSQYVWLILACLVNAFDLVSTVIGLRLGIPEDNPVMSGVLDLGGELAMYALKIVIIAGLILFVGRIQHRYRYAWVFFLPMILPPIVAVLNNLVLIFHAIS